MIIADNSDKDYDYKLPATANPASPSFYFCLKINRLRDTTHVLNADLESN